MIFKNDKVLGFKIKEPETVTGAGNEMDLVLRCENTNTEGLLSNCYAKCFLDQKTKNNENSVSFSMDFYINDLEKEEDIDILYELVLPYKDKVAEMFFVETDMIEVEKYKEVVVISIKGKEFKHSIKKILYFYDDLWAIKDKDLPKEVRDFLLEKWERLPVDYHIVYKKGGIKTKSPKFFEIINQLKDMKPEDAIELIKVNCMI